MAILIGDLLVGIYMAETQFARLRVSDWRQFHEIDIAFHPRLTVITGANGAGKSTILRLLGQHFGYSPPLLATPKISSGGLVSYISGLRARFFRRAQVTNEPIVGELLYSNGESTPLAVHSAHSVQYGASFLHQQKVLGLNIGSHRPVSSYMQIQSIPTTAITADIAHTQYTNEVTTRLQNSNTGYSPVYRMKEAIISMAMFGRGNADVIPNPSITKTYEGFKEVLARVLPPSLGFIGISVRIPDVVLITRSGEFLIDAASGGVMSLIDLAWQIYLYSQDKATFAVILDEPENHLHPSMQRTILSSLIDAFPQAQFIVATHSPFIVSSVRESTVFVLRYGNEEAVDDVTSERFVYSEKLDHGEKIGTASEILRDVLGVPVTIPIWAENDVANIAAAYTINDINGESITDLRQRLDGAGLGEYYPDVIRKIAERR